MAKVKQGTADSKAGKKKGVSGRNDLVKQFTDGHTFVFDDPQQTLAEFISYNGGKGVHAFNIVRSDGTKGKSGRTGLKYLMHKDGRSLLDHLPKGKAGRPKAAKAKDDEGKSKEEVAEPVAAATGDPDSEFDFLDK